MEGLGVLLITTIQRLVVIDLTKKSENQAGQSAVKVFNFVEKGFPFAPSFFMRGSNLYIFGGEETLSGLSEQRLLTSSSTNLDLTSETGGLSRKIYVSNLTTLDSITEFEEHFLKTLAPKASPIVEEVQGMIYVLAGHPYHFKDFMPTPAFEAYDLTRNRFETLPTPPFYTFLNYKNPDYIVRGHCVLSDTIYVRAGTKYYSYSTNRRAWDCLETLPVVHESFLPGNNGKYVPGYEDVIIYFSGDEELLMALMLLPTDRQGEIRGAPNRWRIQCLNEVYSVQETVFWRGDGVIVAMDEHEHQMCFVRPEVLENENDNTLLHRIHVVIFRVEKLTSSSASYPESSSHHHRAPGGHEVQGREDNPSPFLSVTCLSNEFYNLDEWGLEVPLIRSVFFHPWP